MEGAKPDLARASANDLKTILKKSCLLNIQKIFLSIFFGIDIHRLVVNCIKNMRVSSKTKYFGDVFLFAVYRIYESLKMRRILYFAKAAEV